MEEKTLELMKKFEQDYEVYVSATDKQTYWIVYARIPKSGGPKACTTCIAEKNTCPGPTKRAMS